MKKTSIVVPLLLFLLTTAQPDYAATVCSAGAVTPAVWRAPATAAHGLQEFNQDVLLVVPEGVTTIGVELWGAGGGGGGGSDETYTVGGAGGGGGASGAYTRATIGVTPGKTYCLIVGRGGRGGTGGARGSAGQDGGDSAVCDGDVILVSAFGGLGGARAADNNKRGAGGRSRTSEPPDALPSALRRAGRDGAIGQEPLFERPGEGGVGGAPVPGSVQPTAAFGGAGGAGASRPDPVRDGMPGGAGSIMITW